MAESTLVWNHPDSLNLPAQGAKGEKTDNLPISREWGGRSGLRREKGADRPHALYTAYMWAWQLLEGPLGTGKRPPGPAPFAPMPHVHIREESWDLTKVSIKMSTSEVPARSRDVGLREPAGAFLSHS